MPMPTKKVQIDHCTAPCLTKSLSNFLWFQEHSDNFPIVQPLNQYIASPTLLPECMTHNLSWIHEHREKSLLIVNRCVVQMKDS